VTLQYVAIQPHCILEAGDVEESPGKIEFLSEPRTMQNILTETTHLPAHETTFT